MNNYNNKRNYYPQNYQITQLENKNRELQKEINLIKNENIQMQNNYYDLNQQSQEKIIELEKSNNNLESKLSEKEKYIKALELKYSNIVKEKEMLISKKNDELNLEKKNINKKDKELSALKLNLKEKEEKLEYLKDNVNKKNNELNSVKDEIYKKNKELNVIKNDIKKKDKTIDSLNEEIRELNVEFNQYKSKYDGALNSFEDMRKDNKRLKSEADDNKNYKELYNKLSDQNKKLKEQLNESQTKDDFLIKKAEDYYDVVIDIDSINSLRKEGWKIIYNEKRKSDYEKIIKDETVKIGVLGMNNVGKSFLLSKLVRVEIPSGYSVETKGISIKYAEKEKGEEAGLCILDSAGHEAPLLIQKNNIFLEGLDKKDLKDKEKNELEEFIKRDEEEELSKDKANTERFLEKLIISLSDMIILVIGKLTRTEQRLINRIKEEAKNNEISKVSKIIIVHNLSQYHKKKEVEKHILNYLTHSATFELETRKFIGKNGEEDRFFFVEKKKEKQENLEVFHYIMAKEGTEAGDYYNGLTLTLIKDQYNTFIGREKKDIPVEIINIFSELSAEIIGEKINKSRLKVEDNKIILIQNEDEKQTTKFNFKNTYIDQDGKYLQNKEFEPKYSLYFYREGDDDEADNYLLLRLEIPGNISKLTARSTDPQTEKYRGIVITIHKEEDNFSEKEKKDFKLINDNRKYGKFAYFIELKKSLHLNKKKALGNTGIYLVDFDDNNKETLKEASQEIKNNLKENANVKEKEFKKIASGVYVMKFSLTQDSYI